MTFGEIYNKVVFLIWGNSTPPTGTATALTGDEGFIANIHRKLQQDYNYWFMREDVVIPSVVSTQAYALPTNFKELIKMSWKVDGEDYWSAPLLPFDNKEAIDEWTVNNVTAEYPTHFEMYDETIVLYPKPSAVRNLHVMGWKYLTRPTSFTSGSSTDNDDLTTHGGDVISYFSAAEMCNVLDEFQKAQIYERKGFEALELLKRQDMRQRQSILVDQLDYSGF